VVVAVFGPALPQPPKIIGRSLRFSLVPHSPHKFRKPDTGLPAPPPPAQQPPPATAAAAMATKVQKIMTQ